MTPSHDVPRPPRRAPVDELAHRLEEIARALHEVNGALQDLLAAGERRPKERRTALQRTRRIAPASR
jgi:hypothetical protein